MTRKSFWFLAGLLALSGGVLSGAECVVSAEKAVLSNDRITAEISLTQGGRILRLFHKRSGKELVSDAKLPGGHGFFSEGIRVPHTAKIDKSYGFMKYSVAEQKKGTAASVTVCSPKDSPVTVKKTYRLRDGEERIYVEYVLTNPGKKDCIGALYINNAMRFTGESRYTLFFPWGFYNTLWNKTTDFRENVFPVNMGVTPAADHFIHDPERDYAMVKGDKISVILESDFRFLDMFYSYCSPNRNANAVVDIFTLPFQIPPLSEGIARKELHASLSDPLEAYKYKFAVTLHIVDTSKAVFDKFKGIAKVKKSEKFAPRLSGQKMFAEFDTPAVIRVKKPLKRYSMAVVSVAHGNAEIGEMFRRLHIQKADVVDTSNLTAFRMTPYFGWEMPHPEMALRPILDKKTQLMLVTGHHEKPIGKNLLNKIVRLVEEGMTFIYVGDRNNFPSLIPDKGGKALAESFFDGMLKERSMAHRNVLVYSRGKGKVIHVKFAMGPGKSEWMRESRVIIPHSPALYQNFPYWESYYSFYGKLFRYAAGIKPDSVIRSVTGDGKTFTVKVQSAGTVRNAVLELLLQNPAGKRIESVLWKGDLKKGINSLKVTLDPKLVVLSGEYLCFLSLQAPKGTLDWFDTAFIHKGQARVLALDTAKETWKKGEAVRGTLLAEGDCDVKLLLRECATNRVACVQKFKLSSGKKVPFTLKKAFPSTEKLFRVEVLLLKKDQILAAAEKTVFMRPDLPPADKIRPLIWGAHVMSWRDALLNKGIAEAGFKIFKAPTAYTKREGDFIGEAKSVYQYGMEYAPLGIEHIRGTKPKKVPHTLRTPCLNNPSYQKLAASKAERVAQRMNQTLSDGCFISDEISLGHYFGHAHDVCYSPYCLKAFRADLKKRYKGDLKALNRDWKRAFKSFDEVIPDTVSASRKRGYYVPVVEHRLFMMKPVTNICRIMADKVKAVSGGRTGLSGMALTNLYQGFDMLETMPFLEGSALYISPFTVDLIRSTMGPNHITGAYTEYDGCRYKVWEQLIGGLQTPAVWWYGHLVRRGDGRLSKEALMLQERFASIRNSGSSHVFSYGKRKKSPVTMVWSTPSMVTADLTWDKSRPYLGETYARNLDSFSQIIRDMGMDMANVMGESDLHKITPATHPIILLPCTIRLSDAQIRILIGYVKQGGTLIADLLPGAFNEFGVERTKNPLLSLFGIRKLGDRIQPHPSLWIGDVLPMHMLYGHTLELEEGTQSFLEIREEFKSVKLGDMRVTGLPRVRSKALLMKRTGKGKAIYMNFSFSRYFTMSGRNDEHSSKARSIVKKVFTLAGVDMTCAPVLPPNSAYARYEMGGIPYIFFSRKTTSSRGRYAIRSARKVHMYNMLEGKYLGLRNVYASILPADTANVIAFFPEKLGSFKGKGSFDSRKVRLTLERKKGASYSEIVRVRVFHNGREILGLAQSLLMKDILSAELDLGLEAASGLWRVEARAAADGSVFDYNFSVK